MKKDIKGFIGKKVAIFCKNREEYNKIASLSNRIVADYNHFGDCLSMENHSSSKKHLFERDNFRIINASDFLENEYIELQYYY